MHCSLKVRGFTFFSFDLFNWLLTLMALFWGINKLTFCVTIKGRTRTPNYSEYSILM